MRSKERSLLIVIYTLTHKTCSGFLSGGRTVPSSREGSGSAKSSPRETRRAVTGLTYVRDCRLGPRFRRYGLERRRVVCSQINCSTYTRERRKAAKGTANAEGAPPGFDTRSIRRTMLLEFRAGRARCKGRCDAVQSCETQKFTLAF